MESKDEKEMRFTTFCYADACNGLLHPSEEFTEDGRRIHYCDTCGKGFAIRKETTNGHLYTPTTL